MDAGDLPSIVATATTDLPALPPPPLVDNVLLFERAVRAHSRRLIAIARAIVGNRVGPEDVVQQALTNLYEHRARYDWREPGGLMRRAVVNEALRILRQPRMAAVADDHPSPADAPSPAAGMIDRETVLKVRAAIDRLPEHFRAALVLCEYEEMAYTEIAATLGCSVPQVKTWLHRGRRQMARMLAEFMEPDGGRAVASADHVKRPARLLRTRYGAGRVDA